MGSPLAACPAIGRARPGRITPKLEQAAIFAAPALYEPFGLGILEAAAAGCALVLGDLASLRENWAGAAAFLPPADRGQWLALVGRLIGDRRERERLGAAARLRAERFTLGSTGEHYRAVYRELIGIAGERRAA